ncbi:MAG: hypothetical protein RR058_07520 [Oscillospiraceae bacterium]
MVKELKIKSISDMKLLNGVATTSQYDVGVHSGSTIVDAKSLLGLLSLDYTQPILCVTEEERFFKKIKGILA